MSSSAAPDSRAAVSSADADVAIRVESLSKCYQIYDKPQHRLWQGLFRGRKQFYRDFWALKDVSFEVRKGETVGIIGRNGSGKSTLLQMICGTLTPTSGSIDVRGRVGALLELGAGFNPEFTGRENVYMNGAVLGLSNAEIDARFDDIVAFADIGQFIEQPLKTYSSGMYVRLAFGVMANISAEVLVIDEALAVGDAVFTQKCMRFLRGFRKNGTILFVSHDTASVVNLCDRAIWIERGLVTRYGSAKGVVEAYLQSTIEASQGTSSATPQEPMERPLKVQISLPSDIQDETQRLEGGEQLEKAWFKLDPEAPSFGKGGASIAAAYMTGEDDTERGAFEGGQPCKLRLLIRANEDISELIVGFHLKDRLGQIVFGENTFASTQIEPVALLQGESAWATFSFRLPFLRSGKYSLDLAVAEGTPDSHVQHQWFFDAFFLDVLSARPIAGLLAIPMREISLVRGQAARKEGSRDRFTPNDCPHTFSSSGASNE
jgi:lipopolysaccharide transport system ATP-binding protein